MIGSCSYKNQENVLFLSEGDMVKVRRTGSKKTQVPVWALP